VAGDIDVRVPTVAHRHTVKVPDRFAAIALPVPAGEYQVTYQIFSAEGLDWETRGLAIRLLPEKPKKRLAYDCPLRDIGLEGTVRKL
jgi:hypothetical protein